MIDAPKNSASSAPEDSRWNPISKTLETLKPQTNKPVKNPARETVEVVSTSNRQQSAGTITTVGVTITITGDVAGKEDIVVSGEVEGNIDSTSSVVTIEKSGRIKGNIVGKQVRIKGTVSGDIKALEKAAISSTGIVQGTIISPGVAIEDGAKFKGCIDMEIGESKEDTSKAPLATLEEDLKPESGNFHEFRRK